MKEAGAKWLEEMFKYISGNPSITGALNGKITNSEQLPGAVVKILILMMMTVTKKTILLLITLCFKLFVVY